MFSVEDRDVRVGGDERTVERVVSLCDGQRTISEIADALEDADREDIHELARILVAHGALVDCTQAYRVFHWQSSTDGQEEASMNTVTSEQAADVRPRLDDPTRLENGDFHPKYSQWLVGSSYEEKHPLVTLLYRDDIIDRLTDTEGYFDRDRVKRALGRSGDIAAGRNA